MTLKKEVQGRITWASHMQGCMSQGKGFGFALRKIIRMCDQFVFLITVAAHGELIAWKPEWTWLDS